MSSSVNDKARVKGWVEFTPAYPDDNFAKPEVIEGLGKVTFRSAGRLRGPVSIDDREYEFLSAQEFMNPTTCKWQLAAVLVGDDFDGSARVHLGRNVLDDVFALGASTLIECRVNGEDITLKAVREDKDPHGQPLERPIYRLTEWRDEDDE